MNNVDKHAHLDIAGRWILEGERYIAEVQKHDKTIAGELASLRHAILAILERLSETQSKLPPIAPMDPFII